VVLLKRQKKEVIDQKPQSIEEFLSPNKVYLPISKNDKILLQKKNVQKGSPLFQNSLKVIYSPISGKINKIVTKGSLYSQTFLEIANNFKEDDKYQGSLETTTMIIQDGKKKMKENPYLKKCMEGKTKIIFNAIEDELYSCHSDILYKEHKEEILLFLDTLASSYNISKVEIYIKTTELATIETFSSFIETYPNMTIHLLPNIYPLSNDTYFREYLKLDSEVIIFHMNEVLEYYYEIIKERKKDFTYVTLIDESSKKGFVVKVKIGTELKEILEFLKLKPKNDTAVVNSLLHGKEESISDIIITDSIEAIFFLVKKDIIELPCTHCGKCILVCPMKCNPYKSVMSHGKQKPTNCLHCGLCSFVCKSHIQIEKVLKEDTNEESNFQTL